MALTGHMGNLGSRGLVLNNQVSLKACLFFLFIVLILGPITAASQKIEFVKGVRVIDNEKGGIWKGQPKIKLTLIRTIGGIDASDPESSFNQIYDVALDSVGNIYVLDSGNNRIQKFDSQGKYLHTIGRAGQGPGDLQSPFSLDIDAQNILYVADTRNLRLQMFEADGRVLRNIKIEDPGIFLIRFLQDRLIAKGGIRRPNEASSKIPPLVEIIDINGNVKNSFGESTNFKEAFLYFHLNRFEFDTDQSGNIFLTFMYQNQIDKYSIFGGVLPFVSIPANSLISSHFSTGRARSR